MQISEIRELLRECENSIIFAIFERARWKRNHKAYEIDTPTGQSIFTQMLEGTEALHTTLGRYSCPEEHPFTEITEKEFPTKNYQINNYLVKNHSSINHNQVILDNYFNLVLPKITEGEDEDEDENLGSAVTADINLLQALSRRIHLGKLVAQSKYNSDPEWYSQPHTDTELFIKLTNQRVEDDIVARLSKKLKNFTKDTSNDLLNIRFNTDTIAEIYQDFIMPTTKQVQISYFRLLQSSINIEI